MRYKIHYVQLNNLIKVVTLRIVEKFRGGNTYEMNCIYCSKHICVINYYEILVNIQKIQSNK